MSEHKVGSFIIHAEKPDVECEENPVQPDSLGVSCLASEDLTPEEVEPENVKTAAGTDYNNSVMSFFKTLVSPSKADSKSDSEDKSKKDPQQTANTKSADQPVSSDNVKSEANVPPSQETPAAKQNTKAPEPPVQPQAPPPPPPPAAIITNEIPKETPTDDIEVINTERMEASPEAPAKDERRNLEGAETRSKGEEKPSKTNLRKFFKLSVRGDAGVTPSEEINGPAPDQQTLDFPDRPFAQAESREPAGTRSKEGSTEALNKLKGSKPDVREQQEPREQERAETDSLQNGGDAAKENTLKRTEKKQSFGGFFKGLVRYLSSFFSNLHVAAVPGAFLMWVKQQQKCYTCQ
uniref:Uncharacterized protein n=1 Tax=Sphaerodactylus townsendi TaxID=933632 RepID=A0ACB8F6N8_9SAUR